MAGLFKKAGKIADKASTYLEDLTSGAYSNDPTLKKIKGLADWQDVGETARNTAWFAADLAPLAISAGPLLPMLTGKNVSDFAEMAGVKTYSKDSKLGKISDFGAKTAGVFAPLAGAVVGGALGSPQVGMAVGKTAQSIGTKGTDLMGQQLGTVVDNKYSQPKDITQQQNSMYKFKSGGLNQYRTINIEKGELLVNPKTLEILDNYNDAPKHPEGKHEIDIRGNREVPVGMAIIPAKLANEFKSATPERKKEIINSLPGFNGNPKAKDGIGPNTYEQFISSTPQGLSITGIDSTPTLIQTGPSSYTFNDATDIPSDIYGNPINTGQVGSQMFFNDYVKYPTTGRPATPITTPTTKLSGDNIMPYAVAGATAPALGFGLYQTIAANRALKKLGKEPYAMYNEQTQPELQASYGFAQGRAADAALRSRYGLSQAQQAMYNQNVARDINTRMQRAQDIGGGNVGSVVGTIMNANKIQAAQQQAALDAQLQMQKQQYADRAAQYAEGLAQRIAMARQGQQNQNIAFQQQLRLQKEKAYGQAKQQGMENMMNAPMQAASILATYYGGK